MDTLTYECEECGKKVTRPIGLSSLSVYPLCSICDTILTYNVRNKLESSDVSRSGDVATEQKS